MTRPEHDEYDGLAVGWALHALEPGEEEVFDLHLATCSRCQATVQESVETLGELAYDVPLVDPPSHLAARIRVATGAEDTNSGQAEVIPLRPPTRPDRLRLSGRPAAAMAAAVVLIALLSWNVVLRNQAVDAERIAAQRQDVITKMTGISTRALLSEKAGRPIAYVAQRSGGLQIVAAGLSPNDRAKFTYVLWGVQGSGRPPQAVGTFDVIRAGTDVRPVTGQAPLSGFSGFAVSLEPGRTAPDRPSQVVATGAAIEAWTT